MNKIDNLNLEMYVKIKDRYELKKIKLPKNASSKFFRTLLATVERELDLIRKHMLSFSDKEKNISLQSLTHPNREIQDKLDKLRIIRHKNIELKNKLRELLQENEFIICPNCGYHMYKQPLNTMYKKVNNKYVLKDTKTDIRFIYSCEHCVLSIGEAEYERQYYWATLREKLIKEGYNYVPTDFGVWYFLDDDNPPHKPPYLENEEEGSWIRTYEYIDVGKKKKFVKITEKNVNTGEIRTIN